MVVAPSALGAYGDNFGLAPIDEPGAQDVPALPGVDAGQSLLPDGRSYAYWAGSCDRAAAPGFDVPIVGGIGSRPATVLAPDSSSAITVFRRSPVSAPLVAPSCMDFGAPRDYPNPVSDIWTKSPYAHPIQGSLVSGCGTFAPCWRLAAQTQAGSHPDGSLVMWVNRVPAGETETAGIPDGAVDNIYVDLPAGFVGDPTAVSECTQEQFAKDPMECPASAQVGVLQLELSGVLNGNVSSVTREDTYPVFNLEPRKGHVAELGFGYASELRLTPVRIVAKARTNGDFGVSTFVGQIPAALPLIGQQVTLWGVPWAAANDRFRFPQQDPRSTACSNQPGTQSDHYIPPGGLSDECQVSYESSWGPIRPFLSNPSECAPQQLSTSLATDQYLRPGPFSSEGDPILAGHPDSGNWKAYRSPAPAVTGCEKPPFGADIDLVPTSTAADSASGLAVGLDVLQNDQPPSNLASDPGDPDDPSAGAPGHWRSDAGLASSQLDKAVVALPEGVAVNPSAATGLRGCTDAQVGLRQLGNPSLFNNGDPYNKDNGADGAECPDAARLGTVTAQTPLLDETLSGEVVLGEPKSTDPTSGQMLRLFLVLRNQERGLIAKVAGSTIADPTTGKLTTTFDRNPRVPVERFDLQFTGGPKGILALPQRCASHPWASTFTPWTAAHNAGGQPIADTGTITTNTNCTYQFTPTLDAGGSTQQPRAHGTLSFTFSRSDGEQWLRGLTARLPQGLLASVRGVPLCSNAQANAGICPAGSKIGIVDASAGSGDPFVLEEKGEVFLTEGYNGGEYGLAVKIRPVAGPFRGPLELSPIIVRQSIRVDRTTAQVTAVSDPFPLIHHGIPLRTREVRVIIDRDRFVLNPSGCSRREIGATLISAESTAANLATPFQVAGCAGLGFRPRLGLRLTGARQVRTGRHPGVRALVRQGAGEAGIRRAEVRLPKSLALDPANAQALCEFEDGTKPDLENHCPRGSIVGRARAISPLLNDPLVGNVYFVKNVRRSSTGNLIRTLPMIVVALRGEISVNLRGVSDTTESGKLVNTFDAVPDAPVSEFRLNIQGGSNGILTVTRTRRGLINLCTKPRSHIAEADIDAHNGRRHDQDPRLKTPCPTKPKKTTKKRKR
jgi:hypothetical protein